MLDKIRISQIPKNQIKLPENRTSFYRNYAFYVKRVLSKTIFQRFLHWFLMKENIDKNLIREVQIRVFPFQKKNGNKLAGRWNKNGDIFIFPKNYEFFKRLEAKHGKKIARLYVSCRARATLIHEILHTKYLSDEDKVRNLTERYFNLYSNNPRTENPESLVSTILFK